MKVTVYRPRESVGLGAPHGFLGEDHPTVGDWVQSAKSVQLDGVDPHRMLHQMGRDFLIYSMDHAREPRFLGYAVENFGAACRTLGYTLPLKDTEACWLTYGPEGLDPGKPDEYQFMLGQIATVFGTSAASEQAAEIGIQWPSRVPPKSGEIRKR
jgi:hypothetical protein